MPAFLKFSFRGAIIGFVTLAAAWVTPNEVLAQTTPDTVTANLNGLAFTLDAETGSILRLEYAGLVMLESEPGRATIIDLATPISEFEPLRQASRFSRGAKIEVVENAVTVRWERLGMVLLNK